jgi:molybdopterin-containing oxidoreductase family membrane subunit
LISALLLLTRQKCRASLNRFAETMTLFAASMAGLFPIFHLGRPDYVYLIIPYPNVQGLWPQWRSALVWDFWAVGTYITFSALFWYVGLVPDLAMLRERAMNRGVRRLYGAFALVWRGAARH